jgi:HAE1 family hydrophobic/amphiphilic exporter-1
VNVENQRAEVTRAAGSVELARAQLNALMLRPMDSPITPSDALSYVAVDIAPDDVIREALANRPDLAVATLSEGVREQLVGVARAEARPSFDFAGNYGRSTRKPENFFDNDFSKWTASINVKIPIFDGRRTAGKVAQAEADLDKARQASELQLRRSNPVGCHGCAECARAGGNHTGTGAAAACRCARHDQLRDGPRSRRVAEDRR